MMGRKSLRAQLEGLLKVRSVEAAKKALSGIPLDDDLKKISEIRELLNVTPRSDVRTAYAAGLVAITCLLVASLLWTVRVPKTHVKLVATSESLAITLAQELVWTGNWALGNGLLRLEDMSRIELPPELAHSNLLSGRAWVEIKNRDVSLKHLDVKSKGQLALAQSEPKQVSISFRNASVLGELEVLGKPIVEAGPSPDRSVSLVESKFDVPGTVTFFHEAAPVPATLRAAPESVIEFLNLHVSEISFAKETPDSDVPFGSGILKGSLTMLSTGETESLNAGSRLRLEGSEGMISRLTISSDGVTVVFDGEVRGAKTGPPGFERQLKPSWLDYLYHQQRLGFFWAAASFLWGLLWSARTLIFK